MARFGAGQMCVNFTGAGDENKERASYPGGDLREASRRQDALRCANRFRFNQNICLAQAG
jgi:hypothetical protein